jgi:hypothetical protein
MRSARSKPGVCTASGALAVSSDVADRFNRATNAPPTNRPAPAGALRINLVSRGRFSVVSDPIRAGSSSGVGIRNRFTSTCPDPSWCRALRRSRRSGDEMLVAGAH